MATKLTTKPTSNSIRSTSKVVPRIDPSKVAQALGAEPTDVASAQLGMGPLSLFQVRQELFRRLQSTGGRPSLSGTSRRTKIPLSDGQWNQLEEIASEVASPAFSPSAGQIASVLLTLSLRSLRSEDTNADNTDPKSEQAKLTTVGG